MLYARIVAPYGSADHKERTGWSCWRRHWDLTLSNARAGTLEAAAHLLASYCGSRAVARPPAVVMASLASGASGSGSGSGSVEAEAEVGSSSELGGTIRIGATDGSSCSYYEATDGSSCRQPRTCYDCLNVDVADVNGVSASTAARYYHFPTLTSDRGDANADCRAACCRRRASARI
jgi:hypothetical protein